MKTIIVAAAAAVALLQVAQAQNYQLGAVTATARSLYANCLDISSRQGLGDALSACACVTGYLGGMLSDRDFEAAGILMRVGEMTETGASQAAIEAEIMAFLERGFTPEDAERVAALIEAAGPRGDAVCSQLEQPGSA